MFAPCERHYSAESRASSSKVDVEAQRPPPQLDLARTQTHRSGHDIIHHDIDNEDGNASSHDNEKKAAHATITEPGKESGGQDAYFERGDEIYSRFSRSRKIVIVAMLSYCSFLAPMSSTAILSASVEVVETYSTTGSIFGISNAMYMLFMGINPLFYGPLGQIYGRKWPLVFSAVTFTAFSAATAVAPNLASYFVFRILTAFQGTSFLVIGSACIGDVYRPVDRATALSAFMSGTLIGPAFGPFLGGIIVTYSSWRNIFWLQTACAGVGAIMVIFLLPETIHRKKSSQLADLPTRRAKAAKLWEWTNPLRVIKLFKYPNLMVAGLASSALVWNMYSLLTPIRYVLNPRFHLTSPLLGALFYIAPGCGYLLGTFFGGRWADRFVKKWAIKRGERVPEDRLRSCLVAIGIVIPACMLIYGWSVEKEVGGIALPVTVMFIQGVAQLFCFPSLNTYCLDVMQGRSSEVVAGNYMIRYAFAAAGSAACLPAIETIGVGGFSTISAAFLFAGGVGIWAVTIWGKGWREHVDEKKEAK
ncbi:MFS general substrate transporter [Polychaeton citri CBS 116435]|uniref:MFS general substrate transporter n=1 Tax=Polychaeton citri CBS 116435 TaxID=1314669 RepID=A0A9P4ULM4_9PEZI|nr:MFS general substrate transporter [Polychaeton citri CBS 116435]